MAKGYSDCFYCGGAVDEHLMPREIRWQGQLLIFEDVPMGVCRQCGEKFLRPEVAKAIDRVLLEQKKPTRTIQVPVYHFDLEVA
jgi:YgiT-type zinc finger domain-containing protein